MASDWTEAMNQWRAESRRAYDMAERHGKALHEQARAECQAAGLDPTLLGIHPHNAMLAFRNGEPWPGIDYARVRRCQWLLSREWEGMPHADRVSARAWNRLLHPLGAPLSAIDTK